MAHHQLATHARASVLTPGYSAAASTAARRQMPAARSGGQRRTVSSAMSRRSGRTARRTSWSLSLSVVGLGRLFAVGQDLYATGPATMYHHDANGWTQIEFPFASFGAALTGSAANDLYVVGGGGGFLHYDGIGWISIAAPT